MTIGEIKIEALKLMFANVGAMSVNDLEYLEDDPNYADYMTKMNGSINRCLQRVTTLLKVPCKVSNSLVASQDNGVYTLDLSSINDLYSVASLDLYDNGIQRNVEYTEITKTLLVVPKQGTYKVVYFPIAQEVTSITGNSTEIDLPRNVACLIPLYVKSELLEEEEPSMAAQARNQFEASLEEIDIAPKTVQRKVRRVV